MSGQASVQVKVSGTKRTSGEHDVQGEFSVEEQTEQSGLHST